MYISHVASIISTVNLLILHLRNTERPNSSLIIKKVMIFTHTYIYSSIKPILHGWPWFHVLQIQKVIWGVFVCYTSRTGPGYSCSSPIDQTNVQILNCKKLCFKKTPRYSIAHTCRVCCCNSNCKE